MPIVRDLRKARSFPLAEIVLPFTLILMPYSYGIFNMGHTALLVVALICFIRNRTIWIQKQFLFTFLYVVIHNLIKAWLWGTFNTYYFNTTILSVSIFFAITVLSGDLDEDALYKAWSIVATAAIVGLLYHMYLIYIAGRPVIMIRILPMPDDLHSFILEYDRPRSFFSEPAAYATFMMPLLFLTLKRRKLLFAIIITLTLFVSTSTSGLVQAFVLWAYFTISGKFGFQKKVVLLGAMGILLLLLLVLPVFQSTIAKLDSTQLEGNARLTRGLQMFWDTNNRYKLLGVRYTSTESYISSGTVDISGINLASRSYSYVNTISYLLIMHGMVGAIIYLSLFYRLFRFGDKAVNPYLMVLFSGLFGQSSFFHSNYPVFMMQCILLFGLSQNKDAKLYFSFNVKRSSVRSKLTGEEQS